MSRLSELIDSIDGRLGEAKQEIASLEAARTALNANSTALTTIPTLAKRARARKIAAAAAASKAPAVVKGSARSDAPQGSSPAQGKPVRPARRRVAKATKVKTAIVPAGTIEVLLSGSESLTTTALAEQANGNRDHVLTVLRELETAGKVRRSGERRSVRWHAITDEDRVAARVAELEAQSKATPRRPARRS